MSRAKYIVTVTREGCGGLAFVEAWTAASYPCGCAKRVKFLGVAISPDPGEAFREALELAKATGLPFWKGWVRDPGDEPGGPAHGWHES